MAPLAAAQQPAPRTRQPAADTAGEERALALEGVTVIDVNRGRLAPEQTVVVVGSRINTVGPRRRVRIPAGARVVDARGKYLIPGLWDMHVHVTGGASVFPFSHDPEITYPLFIGNGVTGIRDAGNNVTPLATLLQWRREVAAGTRVGPRDVVAGPFVQGVSTPERGRCLASACMTSWRSW